MTESIKIKPKNITAKGNEIVFKNAAFVNELIRNPRRLLTGLGLSKAGIKTTDITVDQAGRVHIKNRKLVTMVRDKMLVSSINGICGLGC